jgi:GNAT superfamily N-acetyltransferase
MAVQYYKRFRMEFDLRRVVPSTLSHEGYRYLAWCPDLLEYHADVKHRSFLGELDSYVFPCLGESSGCLQLMHEIVDRSGFVPEATWLAVYEGGQASLPRFCGTIQGLSTSDRSGSIQNVGTVPEHRQRGIGANLVVRALRGFQQSGLRRAYLEVTAQNARAVRLYSRLGFRITRTLYKAVEIAYT